MMKAVIFDMDGLMIDTEIVNYQFFGRYFQTLGIQLSLDDYCICFTGKSIDYGLDSVRELYHLDFRNEDYFEYFKDFRREWENQIVPLKPGLIELLEYLKTQDIKLAIATSSDRKRVQRLFQPYSVLNNFDAIVCGPDVKAGKPAPDIFLKACEKLSVAPIDALVLEDSETGIEASYRAKIPVICIPDLKQPDERHARMTSAILPSLREVIDEIRRMR